MADRSILTPDLLRQLLRYEPHTGKLFWRYRPSARKTWNTRFAGKRAFTSKGTGGYWRGTVQNIYVMAHRVAYAIYYGEWPGTVDHINGDPSDNRICNLRAATQAENCQNQPLRYANKSGTLGVSWDTSRRKWFATITVNRKQIALGRFKDRDDAVIARKSAETKYGFHPNHGRPLQRKEL